MERIALQLSNVCINVPCARCGCRWETGDLEPHLVSDQEVLGVVCAQCCEAVDPTLARLVAVWHSAQGLIPPDFEGNPPDFWDELLRRVAAAVEAQLSLGTDNAQPKRFTLGDKAREGYREHGRGAVLFEEGSHRSAVASLGYVTLDEINNERDRRASGELGEFVDLTPALPLIEGYDPSAEYVLLRVLDHDPVVSETIRF